MMREDQAVAAAVHYIRRHWSARPRTALILGTGLGGLADEIQADAVLPYHEIPHFPASTALSHKSQLICGQLNGAAVVTMNGRCHLYEGHAADRLALPVRVMHRLGAERLIVSNASGGVNPQLAAGDILVMDDHINLMWTAPAPAGGRNGVGLDPACGRAPRAPRYDPELVELALSVARREGFAATRGVYVSVTGPTYETRAEYRMFRRLGGDVVGMSTVPETIAASECGMRILALSLVTNVARPDALDFIDAEDVVAVAQQSARHLLQIVRAAV